MLAEYLGRNMFPVVITVTVVDAVIVLRLSVVLFSLSVVVDRQLFGKTDAFAVQGDDMLVVRDNKYVLEPEVASLGDCVVGTSALDLVDSIVPAGIYTLELEDEIDSILVTFTLVTFKELFPVTLAFCNVSVMFSIVKLDLLSKITLVSATTLPRENDSTFALMYPLPVLK